MSRSTRSGRKRKPAPDPLTVPVKSKRVKTSANQFKETIEGMLHPIVPPRFEDDPLLSTTTTTTHGASSATTAHEKLQATALPGTSDDMAGTSKDLAAAAATVARENNDRVVKDRVVKVRRTPRRNLMKPMNGSWLSHVGSIVTYRCVQGALQRSHDYRESIETTDWSEAKSDLNITPDDLKVIWVLIKKEYEGIHLCDIEKDLKAFSLLSVDRFTREDTKLKYKAEMPKAPLSAYMLYSKSVIHKVRERYPDLPSKEIVTKIGQKWQSLSDDKQKKFRDEYTLMREDYNEKMKDFLVKHPEARPTRARRRKDQPRKDRAKRVRFVDPEAEKIRELRGLKPKCLTTAFAVFCKHKRESFTSKHPDLTPKEITTQLSVRWKAKNDKDKAKYRKEFIDLHALYKEELKQFYETFPEAKILLAKKPRKAPETESKSDIKGGENAGSGNIQNQQLSSSEEEEDDDLESHSGKQLGANKTSRTSYRQLVPLTGPLSARGQGQNGIETSDDEQSDSSDHESD